MKRSAWVVFIILPALVPQGVFAAEDHLNDQQKLGRRLFEQSCGVCHTRPTSVSGMYGPELSKINLGGQEELLRTFSSNGTARMPRCQDTYSPEANTPTALSRSLPTPPTSRPCRRAHRRFPPPGPRQRPQRRCSKGALRTDFTVGGTL